MFREQFGKNLDKWIFQRLSKYNTLAQVRRMRLYCMLTSYAKSFIHSDCQYIFSQRKNIWQNHKSKTMCFNYNTKIVKITKVALLPFFWDCISFKLHCSQPIWIEKFFHVLYILLKFKTTAVHNKQLVKIWVGFLCSW